MMGVGATEATAAELDTKSPSAVMLPSAGRSLSMRDSSLI